MHLARLPDDGARPGALTPEPPVQHRADRQGNRGDIDGRSRHQQGRGGLVAADHQDHAVDRIAVQRLRQRQVGKVAVQHCRRSLSGFLDRVHGDLDHGPALADHAVSHALGQLDVMAIAR